MKFKFLLACLFSGSTLVAGTASAQWAPYTSAADEVTLIITHGQSLSIGVSVNGPSVSIAPGEFPLQALTLQSGNATKNSIGWQATAVNPSLITGFTPFFQSFVYNESPGSGMLSAILASFDRQSLARPTLLHIHGGSGGRSLTELMLRNSDFYADVNSGLAGTTEGNPFVVYDSVLKKYSYYLKKNGVAANAIVATDAATVKPVYYNNILEQVRRAVAIAQSKNLRIHKDVYMVWIQGQNDANNANYAPLLKELLARLENDLRVETGHGANMKFHSMLSQLRGNGDKNRSIDMLQVANDVSNSHFAAQESWISNAFGTSNGTGTHLVKAGYRILGEQVGNAIFDVMMNGTESFGVISNVSVSGKVVTVTFGGIRGQLVDDPSIHQAMNHAIPPHFGCALFNTAGNLLSGNSIISSQIINGNQVQLTLANNISGSFYLYFGRSRVLLNPTMPGTMLAGTTLRDSVKDPFVGAALAPATIIGQDIPRFIPIQRILLSAGQTSYTGYSGILSPEQ